MFLICFSKDNHIISYSSDAWHTEENCVKFSLEHILRYVENALIISSETCKEV